MSLRTGLFWFWGAILVGGAAGAAGLQMMGAPDSAAASTATARPAADPKEATAAGMDLQFSPAPASVQSAAQAAPALPPLPPLAKAPPVPQPAPRESVARTTHAPAHRTTQAGTHSSRRSVVAAKRPAHRSVTVARNNSTATTVTEEPVYAAPPRSYVYSPYPRRWAPYAQAYYPAYPYYPYYAPYGIGD